MPRLRINRDKLGTPDFPEDNPSTPTTEHDESYWQGKNPNIGYVYKKRFWTFYVVLIAALQLFLEFLPWIDNTLAWTLTLTIHHTFTFWVLHWQKGMGFDYDQGKYADLTMWEQLDDGTQYTWVRKLFTAIPLVLFLVADYFAKFTGAHYYGNLALVVIVTIGKLPFMHRIRIFGVNKD